MTTEMTLAALAGAVMQPQPAAWQAPPAPTSALEAGLAALQSESWVASGNNVLRHAVPMQESAHAQQTGDTASAISTQKRQLATITANMQQFLTQHAGMEALPVVLMLEQIRSMAQVRQELPDYLTLIEPFGEAAMAHARHLQALLDAAS